MLKKIVGLAVSLLPSHHEPFPLAQLPPEIQQEIFLYLKRDYERQVREHEHAIWHFIAQCRNKHAQFELISGGSTLWPEEKKVALLNGIFQIIHKKKFFSNKIQFAWSHNGVKGKIQAACIDSSNKVIAFLANRGVRNNRFCYQGFSLIDLDDSKPHPVLTEAPYYYFETYFNPHYFCDRQDTFDIKTQQQPAVRGYVHFRAFDGINYLCKPIMHMAVSPSKRFIAVSNHYQIFLLDLLKKNVVYKLLEVPLSRSSLEDNFDTMYFDPCSQVLVVEFSKIYREARNSSTPVKMINIRQENPPQNINDYFRIKGICKEWYKQL